ncbi:LOW QUALITY PROTEIN: hypothetical protein PHMEG_00035585 [Phytophthora megakarya]|uniref:Uncharacterized protein n=1 Tax=Phytophthora megakarya TaxID=4795 RepID=A0A225UNG1_9STRA|nr:LOW QUALITY PROTEIN: hypothetical protein PHMEG_00035585 [Phytophthora megakarya]
MMYHSKIRVIRTSIKDTKKKAKQYKRVEGEYQHKKKLLDYIAEGHISTEALLKFYPNFEGKSAGRCNNLSAYVGPTQKTSTVYVKPVEVVILISLSVATVLSQKAEEEIVLWINTLCKDGAPVSRKRLE